MRQVVLVTGGSSGIGRAVAKHLADHQYSVFGTSRKAESGDTLDGFTLVKMDVCSEDSVHDAIEFIKKKEGRLDIVINNAGLGMAGPIENTTFQEADELFRTNVHGILNVCRAALPLLRESARARIINVTSIGGRVSLPFRGIYCASKFAVEGISEALSMELKPWDIAVTLVEPGDFQTQINKNRRVASTIDPQLYKQDFEQTLEQINDEVTNGLPPEIMAENILSIIRKENPKLRYQVGTFVQKLSLTLKQILPGRFFETLILNHYKLKNRHR